MGLFGDNEEKQREKAQAREEFIRTFTDKYNLDAVSDEDLRVVMQIALSAWHDGENDQNMRVANAVFYRPVYECLRATMEQNWIIINQLNRLNDNIEKLMNR